MRGLSGRRAILTGGASGIGRATVLRLAEEGVDVGVFDLDLAGAEETAHLAETAPGAVRPYKVDIADYDGVADAGDRRISVADPGQAWERASPAIPALDHLWTARADRPQRR